MKDHEEAEASRTPAQEQVLTLKVLSEAMSKSVKRPRNGRVVSG